MRCTLHSTITPTRMENSIYCLAPRLCSCGALILLSAALSNGSASGADEAEDIFTTAKKALRESQTINSKVVGFSGEDGSPFREVSSQIAPEGSILIGFELGLGKDQKGVHTIQAIYETAKGDVKRGATFGLLGDFKDGKKTIKKKVESYDTLKADPGYAVGAVIIRGSGGGIDALALQFMRVRNGRLDPKDGI